MKRRKKRGGEGPEPLAEQDAALLEEQLQGLAQGLAAGEDLEELRRRLEVRPADPAWDLQLIRRLEQTLHPAVPRLLAALFADTPDKIRRKALRRALHVLQTKGVPVPSDLLPREQPELLAPSGPPQFQGHLSPIWGNGESFVFLEGPREILEGNFLVGRLQDELGLLECHLLSLSRRQREELWQELHEDGLGPMASAPPAYVLELLEEHLALTPDGEPSREEYLPLRETLWRHLGQPQGGFTPEALLGPLSPGERGRCLEDSRRLAGDPLFRSWVPPLSELEPWLAKLAEARNSPIILSEQQQALRLEGIKAEALKALYPEASRPRWGRRLLRMAVYLHFQGRGEDAQAARAGAEELLTAERTPLAGEHPFLQELVNQALLVAEMIKNQEKEKEWPASSLILPPTTPWFRE